MLFTSMACNEWKRVVMYEVALMTALQKLYIFYYRHKNCLSKTCEFNNRDMKSLNSLEFPQTLVSSPIPI